MESIPTKPRETQYWTDEDFWFVVALSFASGAVFNYLPVSFPVFRQHFGSNLEEMGRSQLLFFISGLVISIVGGWFVGRLGLRRASVSSLACLAVALLIIGIARSFRIVLFGAFLLGLAVAAIIVMYSSMISQGFGDKRQSVFFVSGIGDALGASVGPAALGWWLGHAEATGRSWRGGYYVSFGAVVALAAWAALLRSATLSGRDATLSGFTAFSTIRDIMSRPTMYGIGLASFLHGVSQGGMVSWVGQLYQNKLQIGTSQAAYFISFNSAGFFAGRSLMSWITARWKVSELLVLSICSAGGTLAFVATIGVPSYIWGLVMFTVAGAFVSGNGPAMNSYTGMRFSTQAATAFALLGGIGNVGGAAGPYLVGLVGNRFGLERGIWFMPMGSLCLAGLAFGWFLRERSLRVSMTT